MDDGRPAPVWTPAKCGLLCVGKDMYFTGNIVLRHVLRPQTRIMASRRGI
jgi:hypothetical protein